MTDSKHTTDKNKDVIYLDVDEDITGIIAKLRGTDKRIVAMVLPKRFGTMQSTVNMKLLKRAAERDKKNLVLITSEASLLPLAGAAGVHVARTLQSKPEIPDVPNAAADVAEDVEETIGEEAEEASLDKNKTLAELSNDDDDSPIELDNETPIAEDKTSSKKSKVKAKKDKKLKIPNFNKFRTWLIAGGAAVVLLIVGLVWALVYAPKADILVNTDSTSVTSSGEITLTTADGVTLDTEKGIIPAQAAETKQTRTAEAEATGQKNNGKKASGSIVITAQNCETTSTPSSVPAGTGVTTNSKTYLTQSKANFTFDKFDDGCLTFKTGSIKITAQSGGADSNTDGTAKFSVASRSDATGSGSAKGGTDDIVKVVTQADIDKAKEQIQQADNKSISDDLTKQLRSQAQFAIVSSLTTTTGDASPSVQPDQQADKVTVTQEVAYKMLGVKQEDLEKFIAASVADKIDSSKQAILSYGLEEATFTLQNSNGDETMIGLHAKVVAGPDLNIEDIKAQVAGMKSSEAKAAIEEYPGVVGVEINYGPFWVKSIPKKTNKINITIEEPEVVDNGTEQDDATEQ